MNRAEYDGGETVSHKTVINIYVNMQTPHWRGYFEDLDFWECVTREFEKRFVKIVQLTSEIVWSNKSSSIWRVIIFLRPNLSPCPHHFQDPPFLISLVTIGKIHSNPIQRAEMLLCLLSTFRTQSYTPFIQTFKKSSLSSQQLSNVPIACLSQQDSL